MVSTAGSITASLEDYLEAIFNIIAEKQAVRPKDIAKRLNVGNSSVTGALRALADKDLIRYAPYDVITLTHAGSNLAKDVVRRHEVLRDFFVHVLAVEAKEADNAACEMEHSIPKLILERFIRFAEFVEACPRGGAKWIAGFGYHCDQDGSLSNCENCIVLTLEEVRQQRFLGESKPMQEMTLKDLKPGEKGRVLKIQSKGAVSQRIVEMGVAPGAVIEVERIAPLGDPIDIKVRGYHLSLRKEEAEGVVVNRL